MSQQELKISLQELATINTKISDYLKEAQTLAENNDFDGVNKILSLSHYPISQLTHCKNVILENLEK
jgi:hypothetical protein